MSEVKNKLPSTNDLGTNNGLTAVKYKISDHSKYITIVEFNKLTAESFTVRLRQANLASKCDNADFLKKSYIDNKMKNLN